jgi:hypothetical protein
MFKSPLTCGAREINIIRKKLKERYTTIWREKINLVKQNPATNRNENKLRTSIQFVLSSCNLIQYFIMLIISIYKGYLPSSPTTAKFEALLPRSALLD